MWLHSLLFQRLVELQPNIESMLDHHHLLMASVISALISSVLCLPVFFSNRDIRGSKHWLAIQLVFPIVIVNLANRPDSPSNAWLLMHNSLICLIPLLLFAGSQAFFNTRKWQRISMAIVAAYFLSFSYYLFIDNDIIARILIIRVIWATYLIMNIALVLQYRRLSQLPIYFFSSVLGALLLLVLYGTLEIIHPVLYTLYPKTFYSVWLSLVCLILPTGLAISFTLLFDGYRQSQVQSLRKQAEYHAGQLKDSLAMLSHELRTPLNAIAGLGQLMQQRSQNNMDKADCQTMIDAAMSLSDMANEFLSFSRLEASEVQHFPIPVAIRPWLTSLFERLVPTATAKQLNLKLTIDNSVSDGYLLDQVKLEQVMTNLIANAIKFTHQGSIIIDISANSHGLSIWVEDQGPGIPQQEIPLLTKAFHRGAHTDQNISGAGLGLTIVSKLLEAMHSELCIESTLGTGSRFGFSLTAKSCDIQAPIVLSGEVVQALRILLIEDIEINSRVLMAMLEQDQHQITLATTGKQALTYLAQQTFDVVLLDMQLPDMFGTDIYTHLRLQSGPNQTIPVIAVTSSLTADALAKYQRLGIHHLVSKPVAHAEIRQVISRACTRLTHKQDVLDHNEHPFPLFDPAPLSWMRTYLGPAEFADYMTAFPNLLEQKYLKIQTAFQHQQADEGKRLLHAFAGMASQVGCIRLAKFANSLESNKPLSDIIAAIGEIPPLMQQSLASMEV